VVAFPGPPAIVGGGATSPFGVSLTIVVPVPWALALLLKLETRTSPGAIVPPDGNSPGHDRHAVGIEIPV
jgi:hypothetical protein